MLPVERYHQQTYFQSTFDSETNSTESYPSTTMDSYYNHPAFNAYAFSDMAIPSVDAQVDMYKSEMARSSSNHSMHLISQEYPPALLPSGSIGSTSSSTVGSPYSGFAHMHPVQGSYHLAVHDTVGRPTILGEEDFHLDYTSSNEPLFHEHENKLAVVSVDPQSLYAQQQYSNASTYPQPAYSSYSPAPSPVPSHHSYLAYNQPITSESYATREASVSSHKSATSPRSSVSSDEDGVEKGRCTFPECGRIFKDLKAHMLTHLTERPEKCPIVTCEYHTKGFARKYDKNRHTLTHYKGTMVCGFCPGSGSPGEKSFNRADVFKRHLTTVHNVEQNPPNSRKRSPNASNKKLTSYCQDATGKCSTCSATFNNAQDFYEHLDDCVLRVVQKEELSESINAYHLAEVASDPEVQATFDRHMIKQEDVPQPFDFDEDEDEDDEEDENDMAVDRYGKAALKVSKMSGNRAVLGGNVSKGKPVKKGMTWSKIGVPLIGKGRKRRKHYPPAWGLAAEKMKMKKRVLCVYDGSRCLVKDDMMLNNEFEVRVRLQEGDSYVTDLDVETIKRANAYHNATDEEKGVWTDGEKEAWMKEQDFIDLMS